MATDPHGRRRCCGSPRTMQTPPNRAGCGRVALIGGDRAGHALFGGWTQVLICSSMHGPRRTEQSIPFISVIACVCSAGSPPWLWEDAFVFSCSGRGGTLLKHQVNWNVQMLLVPISSVREEEIIFFFIAEKPVKKLCVRSKNLFRWKLLPFIYKLRSFSRKKSIALNQ